MELSGLIFVALAVAWAVYLIPKAIRHHDEAARKRSVERFSSRLRVLARREPVDARTARLVVEPGVASAPAPESSSTPTRFAAPAPSPEQRRASVRRATKRRRTVLALLLVANATVVTLAATRVVAWPYAAIPAGLLVAWLVACRLMVRSERGLRVVPVRLPSRHRTAPAVSVDPAAPASDPSSDPAAVASVAADPSLEDTGAIPVVPAASGSDPDLWDPLPMQLPTYVNKPAARRTVRTIDLESTGVWTSGRTDSDAALAREADEAERAARAERRDGDDRAVGS